MRVTNVLVDGGPQDRAVRPAVVHVVGRGVRPFLRMVQSPMSTKATGVIRATQTGIPIYVGLLRKLTMQTVADRTWKSCRALP